MSSNEATSIISFDDGVMSSITEVYTKSSPSAVDIAEPLQEDDIVIAVMGPTGAGKSTFISRVTNYDVKIGNSLTSCTTDLGIIRLPSPYPTAGFGDLVLVDTPGFDDTNTSDVDILNMIYKWLKRGDVRLSGLLYFHRISDNRVAGTPKPNLGMFEKLCGKNMFDSVILVTTMWGEVEHQVGKHREKELKEKYWKVMTSLGSQTKRFIPEQGRQSGFDILQSLVLVAVERNQKRGSKGHEQDHMGKLMRMLRRQRGNPSFQTVLLQDEANKGYDLPNTSAGKELYNKLEFIAEKRQLLLERITKEADGARAEGDHDNIGYLMEELDKIQKEFVQISDEMQRMKVPRGQWFKRLLGRP